jgi:hypothetical protein
MTIEQILSIEPALEIVENYVKTKNEQGKKEIVHWWFVWHNCKKMQTKLIGDEAENEELSSSECFDLWHDYLMSLTPNCK